MVLGSVCTWHWRPQVARVSKDTLAINYLQYHEWKFYKASFYMYHQEVWWWWPPSITQQCSRRRCRHRYPLSTKRMKFVKVKKQYSPKWLSKSKKIHNFLSKNKKVVRHFHFAKYKKLLFLSKKILSQNDFWAKVNFFCLFSIYRGVAPPPIYKKDISWIYKFAKKRYICRWCISWIMTSNMCVCEGEDVQHMACSRQWEDVR